MRVRGVIGLSSRLLFVVVFFAASINYMFQTSAVHAASITTRSLTLQTGSTGDGGSKAGGTVNHFFDFLLPGNNTVGSILFEYCDSARESINNPGCTIPTGLDTSSASLGSESGVTGMTLDVSTQGKPFLHRSAAAIGSDVAVTYRLDDIINPTSENSTFFVRISTYVSEDATGTKLDTGTVAASTASQIVLTGVVPESIVFCTGETVGVTVNGIPDCSNVTPGSIEFADLFSQSATISATSQMAASTNASGGYVITVHGDTLTNGTNTIRAMDSRAAAQVGIGQFGMNLVANTTPAIGADVTDPPDGTDLKGEAVGDYAVADEFKFLSGDTVASSTNGGAGPTNSQIYTVSYIVNVPANQTAGQYTATLTYICTATF